MYANLPYDEMHAPVVGPAHPFQKDGIAAGMKNHRSGHVEVRKALIRLPVAPPGSAARGSASTGRMDNETVDRMDNKTMDWTVPF